MGPRGGGDDGGVPWAPSGIQLTGERRKCVERGPDQMPGPTEPKNYRSTDLSLCDLLKLRLRENKASIQHVENSVPGAIRKDEDTQPSRSPENKENKQGNKSK